MPEAIYQVKNCRKCDTHKKAGHEWEIESHILAAIIDIARQMSQWQMSSAEPHKKQSNNQEDRAEDNQQLSEFAHDFFSSPGPTKRLGRIASLAAKHSTITLVSMPVGATGLAKIIR